MQKTFNCTYDWIQNAVFSHADRLVQTGIRHVVAILRGGTVPGFLAARLLDARMHFLSFSRKSAKPAWSTQPPPDGAHVLLVDDIAGEGITLTTCKAFLEAHGHRVTTLTLGFDNRSRLIPDFSTAFGDQIMVLPWEPHRMNEAFVTDLAKGVFHDDTAYELVGLDLDGVIAPDVPESVYLQNLEAALVQRDGLTPHQASLLPPLRRNATVIITARPRCDIERTLRWLDRHGWGGIPVHFRDEAQFTAAESGLYKADLCLQLGVTHFYESDLLQAVMIAERCPLAQVFCWNNDTQLRVRMGQPQVLSMPHAHL